MSTPTRRKATPADTRTVRLPNILAELVAPCHSPKTAKARTGRAMQVCILLANQYRLWDHLNEIAISRGIAELAGEAAE